MSCIVLRRVERQPGEADTEFLFRVLSGFANAASLIADEASGEGHIELYKRGRADGMRDMSALFVAALQELRMRDAERSNSDAAKLN